MASDRPELGSLRQGSVDLPVLVTERAGAILVRELDPEFGGDAMTLLSEGHYGCLSAALAEAAQQGPQLVSGALGPPDRHPRKIWGIGLNYQDHAEDLSAPTPDEPASFIKADHTIIHWPRRSDHPSLAEPACHRRGGARDRHRSILSERLRGGRARLRLRRLPDLGPDRRGHSQAQPALPHPGQELSHVLLLRTHDHSPGGGAGGVRVAVGDRGQHHPERPGPAHQPGRRHDLLRGDADQLSKPGDAALPGRHHLHRHPRCGRSSGRGRGGVPSGEAGHPEQSGGAGASATER